MKKAAIIATLVLTAAVVITSCDSKRQPGKVYMPDMAYSRAYESYAQRDSSVFTTDPSDASHKIFFNNLPPAGTIKRGDQFPFPVAFDNSKSTIDSNAALVAQLAQVKNPLPELTGRDLEEAGRLFNINCAVCHGAKAENNGPVAPKIGGVKSIVATSPKYSDGRLFYVMTYGQMNMGSYASQLSREQRWRIVQYIRTLEPKTAAAPATDAAAPKTDSAAVKK
ncbi:MAG TPA: cytochrome c [Ferruginibacter sp.]|nr:quinol:cytochrome C oxidoreductase [Chitinophagaceae bacterium]HRI23177.1 cytochrome c [Ferruginibacter sp.]